MKINKLIEILNCSDQTKSVRLLLVYINSALLKRQYNDVAEIISNLNKLFCKIPKQIYLPVVRAVVFHSFHSKILQDTLEQSILLIKQKGATTWSISQKEIDHVVLSIKPQERKNNVST